MSVFLASGRNNKVQKSILIFFLIAVGALFLLFFSPASKAYAAIEDSVAELSSGDSSSEETSQEGEGDFYSEGSPSGEEGQGDIDGKCPDEEGTADGSQESTTGGFVEGTIGGGDSDGEPAAEEVQAEEEGSPENGEAGEEDDAAHGLATDDNAAEDNAAEDNAADEQSGAAEDEDSEAEGDSDAEVNSEESDEKELNSEQDAAQDAEQDADQKDNQEANQENNTVNTLVDPYGTVYDAITKQAIAEATVSLEQLLDGEYVAYGNAGDGLPYDCIDGTYNFVFEIGDYRITASAEGYLSYTWSFSQTDDTKHKIDFYLVPQKKDESGNWVVDGEENPVADSITSGWCSFDNKVIIDRDIYSPGQDIEIRAPNGENGEAEEEPFTSITVNEGVTISTRRLAEGETDQAAGISGGDSGDILLLAPEITIGKNAKILAHVINPEGSAYTAGNITLRAHKIADYDWEDILHYNNDITKTEINILDGAHIQGGVVTLTAISDNTVIFSDIVPGEGGPTEDALLDWGIETGIEFLEEFSLIGGVAISKATSLITLGVGSQIFALSLLAESLAYIDARTAPFGLGAGVAVAIGESEAQINIKGKITTSGNCTLRSLADNTILANGSASTAIGGVAVGVAVSVLNSKSYVLAADSSEFSVGGSLTLEAKTIDRNCTMGVSATGPDGKLGAAVAVSYEYGDTQAYLDGKADVTGNITVNALMEKQKINSSVVGIPTTRNGVNAAAGVNTNCQNDILAETKSKILGKVKSFIWGGLKDLVGKKSEEANDKTGDQTRAFEMAAAVAVYSDTNLVKARIGNPEAAQKAAVQSKGFITVNAKAESQPYMIAIATVKEPADTSNPPAGGSGNPAGGSEDATGVKFAGSAAVAIGMFTNEVVSYVGKGSAVDAAKDLTVKAEALNEYDFAYGQNIIEIWNKVFTSTDDGRQTVVTDDIIEVKEGHSAGGEAGNLYKYIGTDPLTVDLDQVDFSNTVLWKDLGSAWKYRTLEFIRVLTTYLDSNFGLADNLVNTWTQSTANGANVSLCGAVTLIDLDNTAHAYFDSDVKVNQNSAADYRTGDQQVAVESVSTNELINFGGNIQFPGITGPGKTWKPEVHFGGPGAGGETAAVGGTVVLIDLNNISKAEIKDGALLYGDNLKVTADNNVFVVTVCASGGQSGTFGLNGTFSLINIDNTTLAQIANGARIVVGTKALPGRTESLLVRANDQSFLINLAGGVAVSNNIGIGASVAINNISRNTQSVVGNFLEDTASDKPDLPDLTINALGSVAIEALNDGYLLSVGLAAADSMEKTPDPGNKKSAPQGNGNYGVGVSAEVVLNNLNDTVLAYIRLASLHSTNLVISARNRTKIIAAGGSVAIVTKDGTSVGLAGSYTQNTITNVTRALIDKSDLNLTGDLTLEAESKEEIISVTASGSGSTSTESASVAGQVSVNIISSVTEASIINQAVISAANVTLTAADNSSIFAIAGALAYGGQAGFGTAVACNDIYTELPGESNPRQANAVKASIQNSDVTAGGKIELEARSNNKILAITAAVGASKGNMALAASFSLNTIETNTLAYIIGKKSTGIMAAGAVTLNAVNNSSILAVAGGLSFAKTASLGLAASYNEIANTLAAYIGEGTAAVQETILKAGSLSLNALADSSILSIAVGGGAGGKAAINGSVSINTINNSVSAYIINSKVEAQTAVSLSAKDQSEIGSIAGAVGGSKTAAIGAALAVNYIGGFGSSGISHRVLSYIENSRVVVTDGTIRLLAQSDAIIKSISAAGGGGGKAAVYGAVSLNFINTEIAAYIKDCLSPAGIPETERKLVKASGNIILDAIDNSAVSVIAGDVAGAGTGAVGAAIAIIFIGNGSLTSFDKYINNDEYTDAGEESESQNFSYDQPTFTDDSKVRAFIYNSHVESTNGSVNITAKANAAIFNISAGAGVGGKAGLQGSVSVNYLRTAVSAYIQNARVEAGEDIILKALTEKRTTIPKSALQAEWAEGEVGTFDGGGDDEGEADSLETQPNSPESLTNIQAIAGAVAGGGAAGIGAAVAVNHLENTYSAYVLASTLSAARDITLSADCLAGIETVSAAAAGAGTFAAAGSVSLNYVKDTILAFISASNVTAGNVDSEGSIKVQARDISSIKSVSGQINFSGAAGLGAAAAYNEITNTVKAYVGDSQAGKTVLRAGGDVIIQSRSTATISTIGAGGSFGAYFGGSATVVINLITDQVYAYFINADVTAEGNVYLLAESSNATNSYGGSFGGGAVGFGAADIVNILKNTTKAYIEQSIVKAQGNGAAVGVPDWDEDGNRQTSAQEVNGLIVIASNQEAITVYSGSVGAGFGGISGQVSTNIIENRTEAYIDSSTINTDGSKGQWVILRAVQSTGTRIYAGSLAAGGAAVGGAVDATIITNTTSAYLKNSTVYALKGVEVKALTGLHPLGDSGQLSIIIAGTSLSGMFSLAGAVSVIVTENTNEAYIQRSEIYSLGSIKVFSSHNVKMDIYGGTVSGSGFVGAGGTVIVSSLKNISRAEVKGSKLNAREAIEIKARSRDNIAVKVGTAGVGLAGGGVAGAVSVILVETTTEASVGSDEDKDSEINQDSRFRPGGMYAPTESTAEPLVPSTQTVLIQADNRTEVETIGGALGAGLSLGLGASIDYISILNRTVAMVGGGTKVYARGNINLEALSEKVVDSAVYSIGGGLFGISGAVSIICVGSPISSEGSGEFDSSLRDQINGDISPNSRLEYKDENGNTKSRLPGDSLGLQVAELISNAKGADVNGALAPDLDTANKITAAFVENAGSAASRAEIVSGEQITIHARNENDLTSRPNNAAAGMLSAGGTFGYINTNENTKAYFGDYGYLRAKNITIKAESFDQADVLCMSAAAALVGGVHAYFALADVQPVISAYIGNHTDVVALTNIQIDAEVTPNVATKVQNVTVTGAVDVGMSRAEVTVEPQVTAWVGDYARIIAGPQAVSGNPSLTLISRGKLTGAPGLEFKGNTIIIEGQFTFERGVVMSDESKLIFDSSNSTITRTEGNWWEDGFKVGDLITVTGTWYNDKDYQIAAISPDGKVLTLAPGSVLADEVADGSSLIEELAGNFTLDDNTDGILTLRREDGGTGWSWTDLGLLTGDYITFTLTDDEGQSYEQKYQITGIDEAVLSLNAFVGEIDPENLATVTLEKPARKIIIRFKDSQANDRVTYDGGESGQSLTELGFAVGDYFTILTSGQGYNSGIYKIIGFENDGRTAILDTMGYVRNAQDSGTAIKEIPSEISRSSGSWLDDGFAPGDIIYVNGTQKNNGYYQIKEIKDGGTTLVLYRGEELIDEIIAPGSGVSIIAQANDRIIRDTGSWIDDGFMPGQTITIDGSTLDAESSNNGIYVIKAISEDGKVLILTVQDVLEKEISNNLIITIDGDYESGLRISARQLLPLLPDGSTGTTATADADGISGSVLAAVNGIYATVNVNSIVVAYVGTWANLNVLGVIEVNALASTKQLAYTDSINVGGLLSVAKNTARVDTTSIIISFIGNNALIRGNDLRITAYGAEYNYAEAIAGGGGALSGLAAEAHTSYNNGPSFWLNDLFGLENYGTIAAIGSGAQINVGLFSLLADHVISFNSRVDTINASLVGGSGGLAQNTVDSNAEVLIGADAIINAYNILAQASNKAVKDWLSDLNNVESGSGGIADFPASRSYTTINFNTNITVGDRAKLTIIGDPFAPGSLNFNAFSWILAKDRVKLAAGGAIAVAKAESKIEADVKTAVNIGKNVFLTSVGDIYLSALVWAEIETKVNVSTWGAASAASGKTLSKVDADNEIVIDDADLFAEGMVNLMAGQNSAEQMNNLNLKARTDIDNNGAAPVSTDPSADALIDLTNLIDIKEGSLIQSVSDTNLIAQKGPTVAEGKASGKDWIKSAYGAEIKGGTGSVDVTPIVRVDGTVEVGLRSQQILIIDENGEIVEISDGITVTRDKAILAEHILNEINTLKSLAVEYAGTEAGLAFANQAAFLEQELKRMGFNFSANEPLPIVWIDIIIVGSIKAEQPNINVLAENGWLIGNGTLNAAKQPALIKIINHSPHYLVLNSLLIPEREGGLLYYNYEPVLGTDLNAEINTRNKSKDEEKEADFTINTSSSSSNPASEIYVENTYGGLNPPGIEVNGSIRNVGVQTNPGKVTIIGRGGISMYGSIDAGILNINAGGSFMQGYTDSLFNVGGSPRAHWGQLASWLQGFSRLPYPYVESDIPLWFWSWNPYKLVQEQINNLINSILDENNPNIGAIRADNIFIAARYLNINGVIEAGRALNEVTLDSETSAKITGYKTLIRLGLMQSVNYKDYPLLENVTGLNLYYDPVQNAIILDPLAVRGGYVELFGQIISTGTGKIIALDGFGRISVNNETGYNLIIKGLDTGFGSPGTVVITDTAKKKDGEDQVFLTTRFKRQYNAQTGTYQVITDTWWTDKREEIISHSSVDGSSATYNPVEGYRYEWVIGQKKMLEEIYTYRSKSWLGADWLAKDPDNLYESSTRNIGSPVLMPNGEYLTYRPDKTDEEYLYWYERRSSSRVLWGYRNWSEQSWFLAPKYYYEEYTYREGYIDVFYHSIRADYPIEIVFAGERQGTILINSKGSIVIDGPVKNESGDTTLSTEGSITSNSDIPIATRNLTLTAGRGIGGNLPLYIALVEDGVLNAETFNGDITIKEAKGDLILGQVIAHNGNVKLEARTGISAANKDTSLVKGRLIELLTAYGSIQGELNSAHTSLRIDTANGEGCGLIAQAALNINLKEISDSLQIIRVVCQAGQALGDITLKVANGSLLNPNRGDYAGNEALFGFWNDHTSGSNTAQDIAAFLKEAALKRLADTNYRVNVPNLIGKNITLEVLLDVGNSEEIEIKFIDGQIQLTEEIMVMLAAAEPGDVVFYDAAGNPVNPVEEGSSVAYLKIKVPQSIILQSTGEVTVLAGGSVYLVSEGNLNINTVSSQTRGAIRIKSAGGISAAGEDPVKIRGGDIILEAAGGSLGDAAKPLTIQHGSNNSLRARSAYDIYLQGVMGNYYGYEFSGALGLDFIYTTGAVNLKSAAVISDARADQEENIVAASLTLQGTAIGQGDNFLELDLLEQGIGPAGNLNVITSAGDIYLSEVNGNMYINSITANDGDVSLRAEGSIYGSFQDEETDIAAQSIILQAVNGAIGSNDNYLNIDTQRGDYGTLTAAGKNNLYIREVSGDLLLSSVTTDNTVYLVSRGNIFNAKTGGVNIIADKVRLRAAGAIGAGDNFLGTSVNYLEADTENGSIWLRNTKNLIIGNISELPGIQSANEVHLETAGSLEVWENILAEGQIVLTTIDTDAAGENILILDGITIRSKNSFLVLRAGDALELQTGSLLQAKGQIFLMIDYSTTDADPGVGGSLKLNGEILASNLSISSQGDNDSITIQTDYSLPHTVLESGAGDDSIILDQLKPVLSQYEGQRSTINLNGQDGSDNYLINLVGNSNYVIIINDTGTGERDKDILIINATANNDQILIRHN
ncbi:MAG TPA: hypothetical protein GXX46_07465, partial [Peptococcaceae bacterium]|nr:hypothetical protein [Peptococcaceae bacterium]